jgi:hypothetical protein
VLPRRHHPRETRNARHAHLTIGSLIFDELDQVDLTGPHEVLSRRRAT